MTILVLLPVLKPNTRGTQRTIRLIFWHYIQPGYQNPLLCTTFPSEAINILYIRLSVHILNTTPINRVQVHGSSAGGDTDELRLLSTSDTFINLRAHGGSLDFLNTKVCSSHESHLGVTVVTLCRSLWLSIRRRSVPHEQVLVRDTAIHVTVGLEIGSRYFRPVLLPSWLPRPAFVVLRVCVAISNHVLLSPPPCTHNIRCSRGTPPQIPQIKIKMMVGRTSAPSQRSSPTTARRAEVGPRRTWERRGWTSRTAKWAILDTKEAKPMA